MVMPIGKEKDFVGLVDLIEMKAFIWADNDAREMTESDIPEPTSRRSAKARRER